MSERSEDGANERSGDEVLVVEIEDEALAGAARLEELAHVHRVHREAACLQRLLRLRRALRHDHVPERAFTVLYM